MIRNETVKVQRPLNDPSGPWLIYGKGRAHMTQLDEANVPTWLKESMGKAVKAYFRASWTKDGWELGERVADQNW